MSSGPETNTKPTLSTSHHAQIPNSVSRPATSDGNPTAEPLSLTEFKRQKGLKIVHLNVRSFFKKKDTIEHDLLDGEIDIGLLGLSETWLKEEIPSNMLNIQNYQLIRLDRQQKNSLGHTKAGGGICIFIKNNIAYDDDMFKHLNVSEKSLEVQFVVITGKNAKMIIIANCYRPPNGSIDIGMQGRSQDFRKGGGGRGGAEICQ